jgi:heterodisulfide reductase subunit B
MVKYATFLGCQIPMRYPCIEIASKKVFEKTGLEAVDLPNYSCCPEPVVSRLLDKTTSLAISARNLAIAEELGSDLITLCNGCYETLVEANMRLKHEPEELQKVNGILKQYGKSYRGTVRVRHVVEVLHEDIGIKRLEQQVVKPQKVRVALHCGCHMYREPEGEDITRKPRMMKELIQLTGVELVDYGLERLCCGYPSMQADEEFSLKNRLLPKLKRIDEAKVDAVVLSCPACMLQFEMGQTLLRKFGFNYKIPCLHIMELLALSLGVPPRDLHLVFHRIPLVRLALMEST